MTKKEIIRRVLRGCIVIAALLAIGSGYVYYIDFLNGNKKQLAVIYPLDILAVERIVKGIDEACARSPYASRVVVRHYGVPVNDKHRIAATAETILESQPAAIISIGGMSTITLHETMQKREIFIPTVFLGVNGGVKFGLIESPERPGGVMTGIDAEAVDLSLTATLLHIVKPSTKKILIPYLLPTDPRDDRARLMIAAVKEALESYGIQVTLIEFGSKENVMDKLLVELPGHDMLYSPEVGSLNYYNVGYSKLCSEMGITFWCGLIDGINLEAAISFGIDPKPIGDTAFEMAIDIVFKGKDPATTPVRMLDDMRELYINLFASSRQGYIPNFAQIVRDLKANPDLAGITKRIHVSRNLNPDLPVPGQGPTA